MAGYDLFRGITVGGPYDEQLNSQPIMGTTFSDTNVPSCTTVYYVATAVTPDGVSSVLSSEVQAVIPCP